jgi:glycosyltransferase involved in cell wall biosynthesis
VESDLISVIYLAPKEIFRKITDKDKLDSVSKKYRLPVKFVLYVGDVNYNKNIPTLIKACDEAGLPLVICGKQAADLERRGVGLDTLTGPRDYLRFLLNKPHPELAHFEQLLKLLENKKVIRVGFVPDDDLVSIYNLASVYCQPSLYEGFGFPVLEAFACETPVVISKTQALVEIAGKAALVADQNDPSDFAAKLLKLINDSSVRLRLMRMGTERLKDFSWEKTARQMLEVYRKVNNS